MESLHCIIIEDQIPAQETLREYIQKTPGLKLLGVYISPLETLQILESGQVDVMFLDIHLPKLSGVQFLESLLSPPQTIITTAFSQYAIDGYELNIVDYLLKPFSFQRFLKSVSKLKKNAQPKTELGRNSIFVRNKGRIKKINLSKVKFIESRGDHVIIDLDSSREIATVSLYKMIESLNENFIRCHKSYIVNVDFVEKIVWNHIVILDKKIPIGRTYKEQLLDKIKLI